MSTTRETAEQLTTTDEALDLLAAEYERATRDLEELKQAARQLIEQETVIDGASRSTASAVRYKRLADLLERLDK